MENLARLCILILTVVTPSLQQVPRFKLLCTNWTANVRFVAFQIELTPMAEYDPDSGRLALFMEARWEIDFSDLPGEIPLDGFAVHFMSINEKRNYSIPNHSDLPTSPCLSGNDHVWVETSDTEACDANATVEYCRDTYPDFCLCRVGNCSLTNDSECIGTEELLKEGQDKYQTVPSTTRKLVFPIEFHVNYEFAITAYYRQFANGSPVTKIGKVIDCPSLFENSTFSQNERREICCSNGIESVIAYNITASEPRPVFARAANATTLNITYTWLPPGDGEAVEKFNTIVHDLVGSNMPRETEVRKIPYDGSPDGDNSTSCKTPKYYYEMEIYDIIPGREYRIDITTVFIKSLQPTECIGTQCQVSAKFFAAVPEDLCQEDFNLCHPLATCENVFDASTSRDASCKCGSGLEGDGMNSDLDLGTGCGEINDCVSDLNECTELAICTDLLSPETGVKCHCTDGFYGDGREQGSGCRSSAETALAIALPIVAVCTIIAAVVIWYVIRERRRRLEKRFQKYVATDNGILTHLNHGADEENGPWEPTFGHQWEIDRKNITFGKVLGRGNYGVVHLAWLSKDDEKKVENGNGAYRDGDFYNPVSSQETDEDHHKIDPYSTAVAVKSLQESTQNLQNLGNFLEEMAFMLNIGKHENIVGIHGCTTTEEPVYLITEYMAYGDLLHFLWDAREESKGRENRIYKVTEGSLCGMAKDVANAMSYLEHIRVIHGDIAARNVLVGEKGVCKLSDFGLANDVYRYGWSKGDKEQLVPFKWISPERMMAGQMPITSKSDVWSFGNLLYEMFTLGCPPHPGVESSGLLHMLRTGYRMKKPRSCNDQVYDLMNKCWRWRASSRPTFAQLLKLLNALTHQIVSKGQVYMATIVEELDREEYANELRNGVQEKKNYVNSNITVVENECDKQTRAM